MLTGRMSFTGGKIVSEWVQPSKIKYHPPPQGTATWRRAVELEVLIFTSPLLPATWRGLSPVLTWSESHQCTGLCDPVQWEWERERERESTLPATVTLAIHVYLCCEFITSVVLKLQPVSRSGVLRRVSWYHVLETTWKQRLVVLTKRHCRVSAALITC